MKNILGIIILSFTVSVFASCNKAGEEKKDTLLEATQDLLKESKTLLDRAEQSEKGEKEKQIEQDDFIQEIDGVLKGMQLDKEAKGQFDLGNKYTNAKYSAKNLKKAVKHFKKSAELDNGEAQHSLSLMYFQGKGVAQNNFEAYKWASLAALQNKKHQQLADLIETKLTKKEIAKAQIMVLEFTAQKQKNK